MAAPEAGKVLTGEVTVDDDDAWLYGGTVNMQMLYRTHVVETYILVAFYFVFCQVWMLLSFVVAERQYTISHVM